MHLRRALLLFAIVLGTAALVASLSRPVENRSDRRQARDPGPPTASPTPTSAPREPLKLDAAMDESASVGAGKATTLEVSVSEPGTVEIPALGVSSPAGPLTPARFELLPAEPGDYEVVFTAAAGGSSEPAGRLRVTSAG